MPHVIHSQELKKIVGDWVSSRASDNGEIGFAGEYNALAVVHNDVLEAGFVYHDWNPKYRTIHMTLAAHSPRWASRKVIDKLLRYPFEEIGVQRITVVINHANKPSLRLAEGVGFTREAILERGAGEYGNLIVLRLFIEDWLNSKFNMEYVNGKSPSSKTPGS